jgi:hypothetical protein
MAVRAYLGTSFARRSSLDRHETIYKDNVQNPDGAVSESVSGGCVGTAGHAACGVSGGVRSLRARARKIAN